MLYGSSKRGQWKMVDLIVPETAAKLMKLRDRLAIEAVRRRDRLATVAVRRQVDKAAKDREARRVAA